MIVDPFNNPDSSLGRVLDWITHRFGWFIAVYAVMCVITWLSAESWLTIPSLVVVVAFCGALSIALLHSQYTRICVPCMQEVPEDAAEQRKWLLRVWHIWTGFGAVPIVAALVLIPLLVSAHLPVTVRSVALAPMEVWGITAASSLRFHHRLRPWCPYCRDWGEDGDIKEPSPDPVNHGGRTT
ncbi:hypothetical protein [Nocardia crassostreae]|uniref:hypothetical protein n=1 Tax=Nocardia crassostreae TaxID=53428 RepID=UPI0008354544|nr:hypothetical protein [Nocardia crassostreae]